MRRSVCARCANKARIRSNCVVDRALRARFRSSNVFAWTYQGPTKSGAERPIHQRYGNVGGRISASASMLAMKPRIATAAAA